MSKALRLVALVLSAVVGTTAPVAAESSAEVQELARRAQSDPNALTRLRQVRDIDGMPADFESALRGAEGEDLRERLRTIESGVGTGEPNVMLLRDAPAQEAARILDSERYKDDEPPRPLRGAIRRVGDWLEPVVAPIGRFFERVGRFFAPVFENRWALGLLGLLIVVLAALAASRLVARRTRAAEAASAGASGGKDRPTDPKELDRQADEAEARGDFERAVRLRFLAGVLRLDKAGAVDYRQSATTGQLVRQVRSSTFTGLAAAFDEIAYGGRGAERRDVERAKSDWPRVMQEAGR